VYELYLMFDYVAFHRYCCLRWGNGGKSGVDYSF